MKIEQTLRAEALATTAEGLRQAFSATRALTVGIEEEVMLLDPASLELAPVAELALQRLEGDPRYKRELPAAQLEIALPPQPDVPSAMRELRGARAELVRAVDGLAAVAAAGAHPSSPPQGELSSHRVYERTRTEYGPVAVRQVVFALQVHVAVGDADRALAVYNAARSFLPLVAALAANAPFLAGRDSGLASVRPKICELLPRQGVPPALASWESYAEALRWGARSGFFPARGSWWWELRLHPRHGTLEFRVPDAQSSLADAGAVTATIQSLVGWLSARHQAGERLPAAESWRIDENRWSACRHGVRGEMASLATGETLATRRLLEGLLDELEPVAAGLGCGAELGRARALAHENGAIAQRRAAERGMPELLRWLVAQFG